MRGSCLVLQSGGPTCVINSSLAGVITQALKSKKYISNVYGSLFGINGILNDNLIDLSKESKREIKNLLYTPSAILGSARHLLPTDLNDSKYDKLLNQFKKYDIRYVFLIGGNDSMDSANKLSAFCKAKQYECNVIGVPKTIDNDLVNIDHTPGYGSAAKYIATTLAEIEADVSCYEKGRVTVVEIMGRDAGWLTAASKLASLSLNGPDLIYLPEHPFDEEKFIEDVRKIYDRNKKVLVVISEGIKDSSGKYLVEKYAINNTNDAFGHVQLGGCGAVLTGLVSSKLNINTRSIELNLPQRCASHISSKTDIMEAFNCGKEAVKLAVNNHTGVMVSMQRKPGKKYQIEYVGKPLNEIANEIKYFPSEWIINGNDISNEFVSYALPLIQKEMKNYKWNSLPRFAKLKKENVK